MKRFDDRMRQGRASKRTIGSDELKTCHSLVLYHYSSFFVSQIVYYVVEIFLTTLRLFFEKLVIKNLIHGVKWKILFPLLIIYTHGIRERANEQYILY